MSARVRGFWWSLVACCACLAAAATFGDANGGDIVTPQEHRRGVEQTFLTFPEWFLVFSPAEYATLTAREQPHEFVFWSHIRQFWESYAAVARETRRRNDPPNAGYHVMILVIGISTTVEYAARSAYETLVGRLASLTHWNKRTAEDEYAARVAQEYVDFIRVRPWYEFDFQSRLTGLWRTTPMWGPGMLRKWERRYALTTEYTIKGLYGWVIERATHSAYDRPKVVTAVWVDKSSCVAGSDYESLRTFDDGSALVLFPRYEAFTAAATQAAQCGAQFREIAGNRSVILISELSADSSPPVGVGQVLFTQPILTQPGLRRGVHVVPVSALSGFLLELQRSGATVEHVFDY